MNLAVDAAELEALVCRTPVGSTSRSRDPTPRDAVEGGEGRTVPPLRRRWLGLGDVARRHSANLLNFPALPEHQDSQAMCGRVRPLFTPAR